MTQKKLAEILAVSLDTIKSLETERLRRGIPSKRIMDRLCQEFGAWWSAKDEAWEFMSQVPFSRQSAELWKSASFDRVTEIDVLCGGLIFLLTKVEDERFASASDAVYRALHDIARAHLPQYNIYGPGTGLVDPDFMRMNLRIVNLWRDGLLTKRPEDVIGFRRERDNYDCFHDPTRPRWNFRSKLPKAEAAKASPNSAPTKRASQSHSRRGAAAESPST
jgi:hypothetical protein